MCRSIACVKRSLVRSVWALALASFATAGLLRAAQAGVVITTTVEGGVVTSVLNLGPQDAGTTINNDSILAPPLFAPGELPVNSYLMSASIDARLDTYGGGDTWANDLSVYVLGSPQNIMQIGGYDTVGNPIYKLGWSNGSDGSIGAKVVDTKVAVSDFPDNIDLNNGLTLASGGWAPASWSGTITLKYALAATDIVWIGASSTTPTLWSDGANWSPAGAPDGAGKGILFGSTLGKGAVDLDSNRTIGRISFDATQPTTISGAGLLTLDNGSIAARLQANGAAAHEIGTAIALTQGVKVNVADAGGALTLSGAIGGTGGMIKDGAGLLILTNAANNFAGGTTLNYGTLQIANLGCLGNDALTFQGGTLRYAAGLNTDISGRINPVAAGQAAKIDTNGNDVVFGSALSGAGGLAKLGAGTLTLSTANTFAGNTTIAAGGGVLLTHSFALQNSTLDYAAAGGAIDFGSLTSVTLGGLTGDKNLVLENSFQVPGSDPAVYEPVALSVGQNNANTEYFGNLSGKGSLIKVGAGTLRLNTNDYTGDTTLKDGILRFRATSLGSTGKINFEGGTLQYRGHGTDFSDRINPIAAGQMAKIDTDPNDVSFNTENGLSGSGGLTKLGTGILRLNAANNYAGGTVLSAGTLQIAAPSSLGSGNIDFQGGTLQYATGLIADISGRINPVATGQMAKIDTNGNDVVFGSAVGGDGGLTKLGAGTLTLSGAHGYAGPTNVSNGTLQVDGSLTGPGGLVTVSAGGILNVSATSSVGRNVTVGGGALNLAGAVAGTLTLTGGSASTVAGGTVPPSVTTADLSNPGTGTVTAVTPLAITNKLKLPMGVTATLSGGTSFTASGSNIVNDAQTGSGARTFKLCGGTLTLAAPSTPLNLNQYTYRVVTGENSGISSLNIYTHAIDFGGNTDGGTLGNPINGVTFQNYFDSSAMKGSQDAGNATAGNDGNFNGNIPAGTYPGLYNLYNDFRFGAGTNNVVLTGLTPGAYYETRLYCRTWGSTGDNRRQQFDAYIGDSTTSQATWTVNEDNPLDSGNTPEWNALVEANGGFANGTAWAMGYVFQADAAGKFTLKAQQVGDGTFHVYGLTNQMVFGGTGAVNFPNTNIAVAASSVLDLGTSSVDHTLGELNLTADGTSLLPTTLSVTNAKSLTVSGISVTAGATGTVAAISGATLKNVGGTASVGSGATLIIDSVLADGNGGAASVNALTKLGGGTLKLIGANTYTGLTTVSAGTLELGAAAQSPVLTGAGVDIQHGKVIFDAANATVIQTLLTASYNAPAGKWQGGKFLSTTAPTTGFTLGWKDDAGNITVMPTFAGDANLDGSVDGIDLDVWKANVGSSSANFAMADLNYDGSVDGLDLDLWKATVGSSGAGGSAASAPVPEPATLALLAVGLLGLLAWRRRD